MPKRKKRQPERREIDLDPDTKDELLAIRAADIKNYWHACRQVAAEIGAEPIDVSAAAHENTSQYAAMWGPEGRPRRE